MDTVTVKIVDEGKAFVAGEQVQYGRIEGVNRLYTNKVLGAFVGQTVTITVVKPKP